MLFTSFKNHLLTIYINHIFAIYYPYIINAFLTHNFFTNAMLKMNKRVLVKVCVEICETVFVVKITAREL